MTPLQEALLAIEIAVDALREADTETARDALEQINFLGFDIRPRFERKADPDDPHPEDRWVEEVTRRDAVQKGLFPE